MGMCHDDSIIRPLFALIHFCVIFQMFFLHVFFPSLADDTYIFNPTHVVPFTFDHFIS
jgi:hypothetical protein